MNGYRNLIIGLLYLATCAYLAFASEPGTIHQLGPAFLGLGAGVTGVVFGRAANKKAENGNTK